MRRFAVILSATALGALAGATRASAASVEPHPLQWATGDKVDWTTGGLLLLFGAAGALVTIFFLVGGVIPGTAGQASIEAANARVEKWSEVLDTCICGKPRAPSAEINSIQTTVASLRTYVTRERWRQYLLASFLYLLLGAFFACVVADDLLQAAVIGAGWTATAGSWGLKTDYSARKERKDEAIDGLKSHMDTLERKAGTPPDPGVLFAGDVPLPDQLEEKVNVALAL
jgi:hypothetical protein